MIESLSIVLFACVSVATADGDVQSAPTREEVVSSLDRAVTYFQANVSASGGYLWRYAPGLMEGEGESTADPRTTAWVQPPGTPSIGEAFLRVWGTTGKLSHLAAAVDAGRALERGQLLSGGWDYRIHFAPKDRDQYAYRTEGKTSAGRRNVTTLDDDTTQSAIRFLMRLDQVLGFQDEVTHETVRFALSALLRAQYPNGAWPQRYSEFADPSEFPIQRASIPDSWSREHPKSRYMGFYTLNDNTLSDCVETLLMAADVYGHDSERSGAYRAAALRGGEFLLLAQLPEPQPAWAQQYDREMHPAWARRFEPPAITGGESQSALRTLLVLYEATGDLKFLEPIPAALAYLQRSRLEDGRFARFYELETNRPLYFTQEYELTYDDGDLPTHYSFKVSDSTRGIERRYQELVARGGAHSPVPTGRASASSLNRRAEAASEPIRNRPSRKLIARTREVLDALDPEGRWLSQGRLRQHAEAAPEGGQIVDCRVFIRHVDVLVEYLDAIGESAE